MTDRAWKAAERRAAKLIGGRRYPANSGHAVDCESASYCIQNKEVRRLSLAELEALAVEIERISVQKSPPKIGLVIVKRRAGRGVSTPMLVVMTGTAFTEMNGTKALGALVAP